MDLQYASGLAFQNLEDGTLAIQQSVDLGVSSITVQLGNGLESDATIDFWLQKIAEQELRSGIPIYIETHRNTATQDIYRTLRIIERHPEIKLTADFSHWYTGLLLSQVFEEKVKQMQEVFQRTAMVHGRIATDGCIQPPMSRVNAVVDGHYQTLWQNVLDQSQVCNDAIPFVIELLSHEIGYDIGQMDADGKWTDASDRWNEALLIKEKIKHWI